MFTAVASLIFMFILEFVTQTVGLNVHDQCSRSSFEQDGYCVVEDFLLPEEIDELKAAGRELCFEAPEEERSVFSGVSKTQSSSQYFMESGDKVSFFYESTALSPDGELLVDPEVALNKVGHALHTDRDVFRKYTFSYRVRELCYLLGYKQPVVPQSMYIYKNPKIGEEVTSHQDATYLYTEPQSVVGFWLALDDATPANGCLKFIRGSHKNGVHRRYTRNPDKTSEQLMIYDKPAPIYPLSNFTPVPVKKGTLVLIHGQVVHRSETNKSNESRHAYTFHVAESIDCEWSKDNWLQPAKDKPFPILYPQINS